MRTEGWGLYMISFFTRIKSPHHLSQGLTKKKKQAGEGLCGGTLCGGNVHPPPCKSMQTCNPRIFFRGNTAYHLYTLVSITPGSGNN